MLKDATAQKDLLAAIGLGDTFIAELSQAAVDVSAIDTYMRKIYANDAMALTAWKSARNLAGPFTP